MYRIWLRAIFILLIPQVIDAQDRKPISFGKISEPEWEVANYSKDTGVSAIVIADLGELHFESDKRVVFVQTRRVKIIDKKGFDAANVLIRFNGGTENSDRVYAVRGYTLRDFFAHIIRKQREQMVFKKKKGT